MENSTDKFRHLHFTKDYIRMNTGKVLTWKHMKFTQLAISTLSIKAKVMGIKIH